MPPTPEPPDEKPPQTDKERLLQFGYEERHIIEYPDGTAILDMEVIKKDLSLKAMQRLVEQSHLSDAEPESQEKITGNEDPRLTDKQS